MRGRELVLRGRDLPATWFDRAIERGAALPAWVSVLALAAMLAAAWVTTYATGGTQRAFPHLFYVPIIVSVLPFGLGGTLVTAAAATVLCGPVMPLNSFTGEEQQVVSWVVRGVMFVLIGGAAGLAWKVRERYSERQLSSEVHSAIARTVTTAAVDEAAVTLVADVIDQRRFHPVFQPVYSLDDGRLLALEALTRFDVEPYRTPDVWFHAAARTGRGVELEIAAIEAALAAVDLVDDLPDDVALSLNASPPTLDDPRLLEVVAAHPHRSIIVEVTEHAIVEDYQLLQRAADRLRGLGVRLAVDDAGAGFSSLRHVVQLAPEVIKLDISLTQGVATSTLRRALAGALIEFARGSGAVLVVEGLEEHSDLTIWTALGADAAQGYLLGRPGPLPVAGRSALIAALRPARA